MNYIEKEQYVYKDGRYLKISSFGESGGSGVATLLTKIKYHDLKVLRDNSQLIPGMMYQITDYECSTYQKNTRSARHKFDIIVQALSENKLSENAKATYHFDEVSSEYEFIPGSEVTETYKICTDPNDHEYEPGPHQIVDKIFYKDLPCLLTSYHYESTTINEHCVYAGTYEWNGTTYDKWAELNPDLTTYDNQYFVITNTIVQRSSSPSGETELEPDGYFVYKSTDGEIIYVDNLDAWELKYCLDDPDRRFSWFKAIRLVNNDSHWPTKYLGTHHINSLSKDLYLYESSISDYFIGFENKTPATGDNAYIIVESDYSVDEVDSCIENPGCIYWMKDEWNNECAYDFKNIQFKRFAVKGISSSAPSITRISAIRALDDKDKGFIIPISSINSSNIFTEDNSYTLVDNYFYTFSSYYYEISGTSMTIKCSDLTHNNNNLNEDGQVRHTRNNKIYPLEDHNDASNTCDLNNIVLMMYSNDSEGYYNGIQDNIFTDCVLISIITTGADIRQNNFNHISGLYIDRDSLYRVNINSVIHLNIVSNNNFEDGELMNSTFYNISTGHISSSYFINNLSAKYINNRIIDSAQGNTDYTTSRTEVIVD